jgi:hypothetical protein
VADATPAACAVGHWTPAPRWCWARLRPSLTLAYARGSGGEDSATRDANFRQTGLHENKARLAGVKRLRRYGELLQPDLSNLAITTLGSGIRWLGNSSAGTGAAPVPARWCPPPRWPRRACRPTRWASSGGWAVNWTWSSRCANGAGWS